MISRELDPVSEFDELSAEQQEYLVNWSSSLSKIKSFNNHRSSYGLKHIFSSSQGAFYVTNGQFKAAMAKAGFSHKLIDNRNWIFNISEKSVKAAIEANMKA